MPHTRRSVLLTTVPGLLLAAAGCLRAQTQSSVESDALQRKPLFQMSPAEVHRYVAQLQQTEPDLRKRVAAIGRKNIGQPYHLNPLGEFPFELHDGLPMFSLERSDCVVFAEHTYAMALSGTWNAFFWTLQRIRYKDGLIGVATRNHYTEMDWNVNNRWLVSDITAELAAPNPPTYSLVVDRARFLKERHNTVRDFPIQTTREAYVPKAQVPDVLQHVQEGDMVNVISMREGSAQTTHVGLIVVGSDGQRHLLHSAEPQVREESFAAFLARAAAREARMAREGKPVSQVIGFKFLRLNDSVAVPPATASTRPASF